jgi:hypothetical protein
MPKRTAVEGSGIRFHPAANGSKRGELPYSPLYASAKFVRAMNTAQLSRRRFLMIYPLPGHARAADHYPTTSLHERISE